MSAARDPLWERLVDDERPRRRELAAAERDLAVLSAPRLPAGEVDRLTRRVVAASTPPPVATSWWRPLAAALLLLAGLGSLAFVGARVVWPEQVVEAEQTSFRQLVQRALDVGLPESERAFWLSKIDGQCLMAIAHLRRLREDRDSGVRDAAAAACDQVFAGWATTREPSPAHADLDHLNQILHASTSTPDDLVAALRTLAPLLALGVQIVAQADFSSEIERARALRRAQRMQSRLQELDDQSTGTATFGQPGAWK